MRTVWRAVFLIVTAMAVGLELWASFDGSPDTEPWTTLIVRYVPAEVTAFAIGGLAVWLAVHFWRRYRRRTDEHPKV